jgi:hypothetical protein
MGHAFGRKVVYSSLATVLLLLSVEGGLTVAGLPSEGIYDGNRFTDWRLKPNLDRDVPHLEEDASFRVITSSLGFRDGEIPADVPWVAALGCSTTFGWGLNAELTWTELLEASLGVNVLNAGVPGHSTHQGKSVALEMIARKPDLLLLGWMVRDVQLAPIADKEVRAPAGLRSTRLFRLIAQARNTEQTNLQGGVHRVGPEDFRANLQEILDAAQAANVPVQLLTFPMQNPPMEYHAIFEGLGLPILSPQLDEKYFFSSDPIHLNAAGNQALAEALHTPLKDALRLIEVVD